MASAQSLTKDSLIVVGQRDRTPRISVVTQTQFDELVETVRELKARYNAVGSPDFPENAEFMKCLREGASLTDAMAAFQLAARMSAAEKALGKIVSLTTELAKNTKGVDLSQFESFDEAFGAEGGVQSEFEMKDEPGKVSTVENQKHLRMTPDARIKQSQQNTQDQEIYPYQQEGGIPKDCVTHTELIESLEKINKEVLENIERAAISTSSDAKKTEKMLNSIKQRLSSSMELAERLTRLEAVVEQCVDRIVAIDTGLTAQVSSYQDQLTQMQHDLEAGLETIEEKIANIGTDPEVIADLGSKLATLHGNVEDTLMKQKYLKVFQSNMADDMAGLWKQIELIRDAKADREEVTDALRDKIGLEDLNGMVRFEHFNAVQGDLELRIKAAYEKFNSQENVWQKFIDDVIKNVNQKCDWVNFNSLRDEINHHLNELQRKVQNLLNVIGEPKALAVSRALFRDTKCISCSSPAHMNMKMPEPLLELPAFRKPDGAEAVHQPEEDGDHGTCFERRPVPHPIDPRAHFCNRYCGGSHTTLPAKSRAPHGMIITRIDRELTDTIGADGKVYKTEEPLLRKACLQCSVLPNTVPAPPTTSAKNAPVSVDLKSSILSTDFLARRNMSSSAEWRDSKFDDTSSLNPATSVS